MRPCLLAGLVGALASTPAFADNAYVTNYDSGTVSVVDTSTDTVIGAPISVGATVFGVAGTLDGSKVYVTHEISNTVAVIDTATKTIVATIPVGVGPWGIAVTPDGA